MQWAGEVSEVGARYGWAVNGSVNNNCYALFPVVRTAELAS
jgi:hypothetical protein